ncbi:MAG: SAM-dependent chlorinase/fluorinase [Endomicrobia bacterium]|nr:SAM-dependent chlorinase/fluorinase [Endomicrobiia bacterium]
MKRFIVLLTDFGNDFYVGQMKGVIKNINEKVEIIDLCHNIQPQNILQASVIIDSSYKFFPAGSIFVCVVDPGVGSKRDILIVRFNKYIFISPNNGLLTKIIQTNNVEVFKVVNTKYFLKPLSNTFHGRDIMSPIAAYLSKGLDINKIATKIDESSIVKIDIPIPKKRFHKDYEVYIGKYLFHDSFGNIVTNLTDDLIRESDLDNYFLKISCKNKIWKIKMKKFYSEVREKEILGYVNSFGYIEVAVNKSSAYALFTSVAPITKFSFNLIYEKK